MTIGLCHKCLTSRIEVQQYDDKGILCQQCYGNLYNKKSAENEPEPTLKDLKNKFERKLF